MVAADSQWQVKSTIMFLMPAVAETCQYFGIPLLGATFDPLDNFMFGLGALIAAFVDVRLFSCVFDFWKMEETDAKSDS